MLHEEKNIAECTTKPRDLFKYRIRVSKDHIFPLSDLGIPAYDIDDTVAMTSASACRLGRGCRKRMQPSNNASRLEGSHLVLANIEQDEH
jgi:hypothetical protein